jgi:hypothetical protein
MVKPQAGIRRTIGNRVVNIIRTQGISEFLIVFQCTVYRMMHWHTICIEITLIGWYLSSFTSQYGTLEHFRSTLVIR